LRRIFQRIPSSETNKVSELPSCGTEGFMEIDLFDEIPRRSKEGRDGNRETRIVKNAQRT